MNKFKKRHFKSVSKYGSIAVMCDQKSTFTYSVPKMIQTEMHGSHHRNGFQMLFVTVICASMCGLVKYSWLNVHAVTN